jgi:hypothetical protein
LISLLLRRRFARPNGLLALEERDAQALAAVAVHKPIAALEPGGPLGPRTDGIIDAPYALIELRKVAGEVRDSRVHGNPSLALAVFDFKDTRGARVACLTLVESAGLASAHLGLPHSNRGLVFENRAHVRADLRRIRHPVDRSQMGGLCRHDLVFLAGDRECARARKVPTVDDLTCH